MTKADIVLIAPELSRVRKAEFEKLPEVSRVVEVATLMPAEQERKLPLLREMSKRLAHLPPRGAAIPHAKPSVPDLQQLLADQAAITTRSVDFSLAGLPPGGVRGEWSRLERASRISSMGTRRLAPGIARRPGHEVTAAASEAQDARIARFSALESVASAKTSRG